MSTAASASRPSVVVLGGGVSGLTSALLLAQKNAYNVTVVAGTFPGDLSPDPYFASPIAGANSLPVSAGGTDAARWDEVTFKELWRLKENPRTGIHIQQTYVYNRGEKDKYTGVGKWFADLLKERPWFADLFPGFRSLEKHELPADTIGGTTFQSVCINVPIYLSYLMSELLALGVTFHRATLNHILDASRYAPNKRADVIVNCTGLRARFLGGVEDEKVYPVRGQIAVVRNDADSMVTISGTDDAADEVVYVMKRPQGGGTVLGGSYQKDNWDTKVDDALAQRILKRCVDICPELKEGGVGTERLDVLRHVVGLRPLREGGVRLEAEKIDGVSVVHNYGHGGFGYQASFGCAEDVVKKVDESLKPSAKL